MGYNLLYWVFGLFQIFTKHWYAIAGNFLVQSTNEPKKKFIVCLHFTFKINGKQWFNLSLPKEHKH
jgi:hypothetical protein